MFFESNKYDLWSYSSILPALLLHLDKASPIEYESEGLKSSVTIFSNSLAVNQTYQFMVVLDNLQNHSRRANGYVLVEMKAHCPVMIAIG